MVLRLCRGLTALPAEQFRSFFRCLLHQKTHLRMRALDVDRKTAASQLFGSQRPYRGDYYSRKCFMKRRRFAHPFSDFEEVPYLNRRCHEKQLHIPTHNRIHCVLKWREVFRESPLIYVDQRQDGTALLQARRQLWISDTIFLNGNTSAINWKRILVLVQKNQQIPPRVWLRNTESDAHPKLFQSSSRLGSAGNYDYIVQSPREFLLCTNALYCGYERPDTNSRRKDHHVHLPCQEVASERHSFMIRVKRDLPD